MADQWDHSTTLAEFLNEPPEVHAWFIGLCQTVQRVRPYRFDELVPNGEFSPELMDDLRKEYHYYYVAFWLPRLIVLVIVLSMTTDIWVDEVCRILLKTLTSWSSLG